MTIKKTFARMVFSAAVLFMGVLPVGHAAAGDEATNFLQKLKAASDATAKSVALLNEEFEQQGYQAGLKADLSEYKEKMLLEAANPERLMSSFYLVQVEVKGKKRAAYWDGYVKALKERLGVKVDYVQPSPLSSMIISFDNLLPIPEDITVLYFAWYK